MHSKNNVFLKICRNSVLRSSKIAEVQLEMLRFTFVNYLDFMKFSNISVELN